MSAGTVDPTALLHRSLASGRIHSAYLLSGAGQAPREAARAFARALACGRGPEACEQCPSCARSSDRDEPELDGTGKRGPLFRHIGDHPDLLWVERGGDATRVRIGQIRALQNALRLGSNEGGWRAAVIADAEWLNLEAQNALLRLLEEPPERTCLILLATSATGLLATIRSRCQRVLFPAAAALELRSPELEDEARELVDRLDAIRAATTSEILDWSEEYRGNRGEAAAQVQVLLAIGSEWLRERVKQAAETQRDPARELRAFRALSHCRRDLAQRNANPQMVAERALFAVRETTS